MAGEPAIVSVLGGSSAWTPRLASALADRAGDLPPLEVRLLGRDLARTRNVARACEAHARARRVPHRWSAWDDPDHAFRGSRIVVNQMRVGGFAGRAHDEALPLRHGLAGDETVGPGGLSAALRGVPVTLAMARRVAVHAPGCHFVNMANPMSILLHALAAVPEIPALGLCELPETTLGAALALLDAEPDGEVDYVGINHQGFLCRVVRDGRDLVPELLAAIARAEAREGSPVAPFRIPVATMREFGAIPLPYLRLLLTPERALEQARGRSRAAELAGLSERLHERYATTTAGTLPEELFARPTPWLDLALVPALVALLGGPAATLYVSEPNRGHLPFLSDDSIVEKRAVVTASGIHPLPLADASLAHAERNRLLTRVAAFERAAARAALDPTTEQLHAAVLALPLTLAPASAAALARELHADPPQAHR